MSDHPLTGEVSNSKLSAVFATPALARVAMGELLAGLDLQPAQVKLLTAGSADVDIALEPEGGNIWRTIVNAHLRLGMVGVLVGVAACGLLYWAGVPFVVQSPWASMLAAVFFGGTAGLLVGGLVSLRPDHDPYIHATRDAIDAGSAVVVVHALSAEQSTRAASFLEARGGAVTRTL